MEISDTDEAVYGVTVFHNVGALGALGRVP
jgi:hypothetical protein